MSKIPISVSFGKDHRTATIVETVRVLMGRGGFDEARLCRYIEDAEIFAAPHGKVIVPPEWTRRVAERVADEFEAWKAGGLQ